MLKARRLKAGFLTLLIVASLFSAFSLFPFTYGVCPASDLYFDDVSRDDWLEVPDADALSIDTTNELTFEMWMNASNPAASGGIFTKNISGTSDGHQWEYSASFFISGGHLWVLWFVNDDTPGNSYLSCSGDANAYLHEYVHYAFVVNVTAPFLGIYANGTQICTDTSTAGTIYPNSASTLYIGGFYNPDLPSQEYEGYMDEVRISNMTRYTAAFTPPTTEFTVDGDTVALYHYNEGSGQVAGDETGDHDAQLGSTTGVDTHDPSWGCTSPIIPPAINIEVSVMGLDCGEWVFSEKFYDYVAVYHNASYLDFAQIRFAEGAGNNIDAYLHYNVTTGPATWGLDSGDDYADLGQVTWSVSGTNLTVMFPIWVELEALDALDVDIYLRSNLTDGTDTGWVEVETDYFNLYVLGGAVETATSGAAYRMDGGDIFQIRATNDSWIAVNATWKNLQHFSTLFSIQVPGNRFEHVDNGGLGKPEYWFMDVGVYVCSPSTDEWYRAWHGETTFYDGDTGTDDLWTTLNTTWYQRETAIKEDLWNLAPEHQNTTTHLRMFLDLWFNQANASQMTGGRITPFFYGMNKDVEWGFMGNWHIEYEETVDADFFDQLEDSDGDVISARQLSMMKVYFNLSRPITDDEYAITLGNFEVLEFHTAKAAMQGVPTPTFAAPRIPDTPGFDLWGFFGDLFGPIGKAIADALAVVGDMIWGFLQQNVPWFTDFWDLVYSALLSFWEFFVVIIGYTVDFLSGIVDAIPLLAYPIQVIVETWNNILVMWEGSGFADVAGVIPIAVVLVFSMMVFGMAEKGDVGGMVDLARQAWGIADAIMQWAYRFIKFLVDIVTGIIP